jgi:hypothetical protein
VEWRRACPLPLDWLDSGMETPGWAVRLRRVLKRRIKCLFRTHAWVKSETLIAVEAEYTCTRCGKVKHSPDFHSSPDNPSTFPGVGS